MLDRKLFREQPDCIRQMLKDRYMEYDLESLLAMDKQWREITAQVETLKAHRNEVSDLIAKKKKAKEDATADITAMRDVSDQIKTLTQTVNELDTQLKEEYLRIPNIPHASVPRGADESANVEIRQWGNKPSTDFKPKPHWELGETLKLFDTEKATKLSGARFAVYTGIGAKLERALIQFMLNVQTEEHGYTEIIPPLLVNRDCMIGTGQLPKLENDSYKTTEDGMYLIPTAEVPVTNLHRQEILKKEKLPIYYAAYTPCFRREAGSYGKDTKGIVRQHQFNKVELVKIVHPDESYNELEKLVINAEEILKRLNLHYRMVVLSRGDMSFSAAKGYDLEVWHDGAKRYWEVSSCSNFEDFQARRANIRFKDTDNKTKFCHTLNGSGLATSRLLPAVMENYQTADGGITIPDVLVPYMGGKKRITPEGELE